MAARRPHLSEAFMTARPRTKTSKNSAKKAGVAAPTRQTPLLNASGIVKRFGNFTANDDVSFSTANSLTDEGFVQHRSQGRFHRVRMNIANKTSSPASFWEFAQGVDIEGQVLGRR